MKNLYFDYIYNPVYDMSTAQVVCYQRMQEECLARLELKNGERILCLGAGTGNEVERILRENRFTDIYAVDMSKTALARAERKAEKFSYILKTFRMDVQEMDFEDGYFDKAVCIHVMGFIEDDEKATGEMLRVLRAGGQFVVTYPSGGGGAGLAGEIRKSITGDIGEGNYRKALRQVSASILAGIVYIPGYFLVRPRKGFYTYENLKKMLEKAGPAEYRIVEDRNYQDYIVHGVK